MDRAAHGVRENARGGVERLARYVPLDGKADAVLAQNAFHDFLQAVLGLYRRVPQIEARLRLSGDDVRRSRAGIDIRDLERRGLKVLGPLVPFAARQLGEGGRERV